MQQPQRRSRTLSRAQTVSPITCSAFFSAVVHSPVASLSSISWPTRSEDIPLRLAVAVVLRRLRPRLRCGTSLPPGHSRGRHRAARRQLRFTVIVILRRLTPAA
jgi:hypothetical protein